jgi:hypothetical protein
MAISDHQLKLGRLTILSPSSLSFSSGAGEANKQVNLSGMLAVADIEEAKYYRDELISMSKLNIPIAFSYTGDTTMKGYCKLESASINIDRYSLGSISYSLDLLWLGNPGEVNMESHFSGALIENDHSITSTTNQMHSPPRQHYAYYHTATITNTEREIYGGNNTLVKTSGSLRDSNATWNCEPENYYEGAVEIKVKDYHDQLRLRTGRDCPNKPTDAVIQNGLMKLVVLGDDTSQCRFTTYLYDPDQDDNTSDITWAISATSAETEWQSWQSIQILKNEPQIATIRLTTHYNADTRDGRLVFDVTLKRGARHIEFVASQWTSQQLNIKSVSALSGDTTATGFIFTEPDNQGNLYSIGSPSSFTADTTNFGIEVSGTTAVKGFIGSNTGTAGANNLPSVRDQYLDSIFETVRVVKS